MRILGVWDGHDAGACIVEDGIVKAAVNEERLSRKKLDITFPQLSIQACLDKTGLKPSDIDTVASCGTQFSRIITRTFPGIDRNYYQFRRRKIDKPSFERQRRYLKYFLAKYNVVALKGVTEWQIRKRLDAMGFKDYSLTIVDHHTAHAASAAFCSGYQKGLCITLDGVGDGLSGSVNVFEDGELKRLSAIKEQDSLGLMYEAATTIIGMREMEDEGKVMAMADYSYPIPDDQNPMMDYFKVDGLNIKARHTTIGRFMALDRLKWKTPLERFAYMLQRSTEATMLQLFTNSIEQTGLRDVCWAGGVASNIKANRVLRLQSGLKDWFVFPHMGDGGLAVGAALWLSNKLAGTKPYKVESVYFGPGFDDSAIETEIKNYPQISYQPESDPSGRAADILSKSDYCFWYQGEMEYGPRALGNRSIIARADSEDVKELLNLQIKKREWFQPFCPSMVDSAAPELLEDYDGKPDRFMTMGYVSRKEVRNKLKSVIHVDGSLRPQMVGAENKKYQSMIENVKKYSGHGIILNTSFNLHGEPIVCTPKDAIDTMIKSGTRNMVMGNFLLERKS